MNGGWRVGRIGGIEVRVDASVALLAALVGFDLWQIFSFGGAAFRAEALGLALGGAALFIASILVHELAHAGFARLRGMPVHQIRLFVFGGQASTGESKRPGDEFLVTVVGPLSSAAIGALFLVAYRARPVAFGLPLFELFFILGWWNLILSIFNLLPALPLDGGRIFHSAVWKVSGNRYRATTVAARAGQGIGLLVAASGVWFLVRSRDPRYLWTILIGWEVNRGAGAELAVARARQAAGTPLREVMTAPPPAIPAELSVRQAAESFLNGHEGEAFPVMQDGKLAGFVSSREVREASAESKVGEFVFQEPGAIEATPEETIQDVMERLGDREWQAILVVDAGRLVGVLEHPVLSTPRRRWTR
jgi:Zn-dependent protease/CBS domain-containing protein